MKITPLYIWKFFICCHTQLFLIIFLISGKYRVGDEELLESQPYHVVGDVAEAINVILKEENFDEV